MARSIVLELEMQSRSHVDGREPVSPTMSNVIHLWSQEPEPGIGTTSTVWRQIVIHVLTDRLNACPPGCVGVVFLFLRFIHLCLKSRFSGEKGDLPSDSSLPK